jgi:hypothetical protein
MTPGGWRRDQQEVILNLTLRGRTLGEALEYGVRLVEVMTDAELA